MLKNPLVVKDAGTVAMPYPPPSLPINGFALLQTDTACTATPKNKAKYDLLFVRPDGKQLAQITNWVERQIVPVIDKVFGLDDNKQEQAKGKIAPYQIPTINALFVLF